MKNGISLIDNRRFIDIYYISCIYRFNLMSKFSIRISNSTNVFTLLYVLATWNFHVQKSAVFSTHPVGVFNHYSFTNRIWIFKFWIKHFEETQNSHSSFYPVFGYILIAILRFSPFKK